MANRITFQCWTCGERIAIHDVRASTCCSVCLHSMTEQMLAALHVNLSSDELVNELHVIGDKLANRMILHPELRVRCGAIAWRNYRGSL